MVALWRGLTARAAWMGAVVRRGRRRSSCPRCGRAVGDGEGGARIVNGGVGASAQQQAAEMLPRAGAEREKGSVRGEGRGGEQRGERAARGGCVPVCVAAAVFE
jgi:hypothetical protein